MYVHVALWILTLSASSISYFKEVSKNIKAEEKIERLEKGVRPEKVFVKDDAKIEVLEKEIKVLEEKRKKIIHADTKFRRKLIEKYGVEKVLELLDEEVL